MSFKRYLYKDLEEWKSSSSRKPLILRGARQVGKTTLIKAFSKSYTNSIMLNLEKKQDAIFFEDYENIQTLNIQTLINALLLRHNIPSRELKETLLFIDEIQESPQAIQMLRYFYEEIPDLHIIAAGSLLEFAIKEVKSFPVGRVEFLYLHPLNFSEFLNALNQSQALIELNNIPVNDYAHTRLLELFNLYTIIGGMPEIVKKYAENQDLTDLPKIYESIWATYKEDIEKYAENNSERKVLKYIIDVAHLYVDQRIKFQNFGNSNYRSREVGVAFRNLDAAKIIRLIYPTTEVHVPIKPNIKKSPRLQFLDTGLVNYDLKIQPELLSLKDLSDAYKGAIIPHIITQELISLNTINNHKPFFWVRDKAQSSSEVDLIYQYKNKMIPIEIKSGATGSLKSLHEFIERTDHNFAVRIYAGKYEIQKHKTPKNKKEYLLLNIPYFLGTKLPEYIALFVDTNSI